MIIYFTFIAIEIKIIGNINVAIFFSRMKCYGISFVIISSFVRYPFCIAAGWIFYIDAQDPVIVFNS